MPTGCHDNVGSAAAGGCQAGSTRLHNYLMARWPGLGSFGCYNPNSRAGSGWSLHREGRAIDVAVGSNLKAKGDEAFHWLIDNADDVGLQEIQWYGLIWTSRRASSGIRRDTSAARNLHFDHIHVGQCWHGALYWQPPAGAKPAPDIDWAGLWLYLDALRRESEVVTLWFAGGFHTFYINKGGVGVAHRWWYASGGWSHEEFLTNETLVEASGLGVAVQGDRIDLTAQTADKKLGHVWGTAAGLKQEVVGR